MHSIIGGEYRSCIYQGVQWYWDISNIGGWHDPPFVIQQYVIFIAYTPRVSYIVLIICKTIMLSSFFLLLLVVETNTLHATFCRTHLRITRVSHRIMQHSLRPAVARPALHPQSPHPPVRCPAQLHKQSSAVMTESRVPGVAESPKWSSRGLASRKIWTFLTQSIVTWFKYS